jgi:hypothetical protein
VQATTKGIKFVKKTAMRERLFLEMETKTVHLSSGTSRTSKLPTDETAASIARRNGIYGRPGMTPGDGSCLFHAVSLSACGGTSKSLEMRYKTAIAMALDKHRLLALAPPSIDLFSPSYSL